MRRARTAVPIIVARMSSRRWGAARCGASGHYGLYVENGGSAEVFLSFVLNPLAIFFATFFAAFFSILDFLVFLAIWCGPPILVAASWTALCASQELRFFI